MKLVKQFRNDRLSSCFNEYERIVGTVDKDDL